MFQLSGCHACVYCLSGGLHQAGCYQAECRGRQTEFLACFAGLDVTRVIRLAAGPLYTGYFCSRAHSAKRARDDRVSCIQAGLYFVRFERLVRYLNE